MDENQQALYRKFLTSKQEPLRLSIALECFDHAEGEAAEAYRRYLRRRLQPAAAALIASGDTARLARLTETGWLTEKQTDSLIALAQREKKPPRWCCCCGGRRRGMAFGTGISPSELGCRIWQVCLSELLDLFPQLHGAFGQLSYTPDASAGGIGTDGRTIFFPPGMLLRLYRDCPAAVRRGYLHMLLHCLYLHPFAEGSRLWDLAWDIAVERMIEGEQAPRLALPASPVRDACLSASGGLSPAGIYDRLVRGEFPFSIEDMEAAFRFDSHMFWRAAPESRTAVKKKWSALQAGAGQGGRSAGASPGHRSETLLVPRKGMYDYRAFLRRFTQPREEVLLDPDSFDPVFYSYGLEHYGNLPLIEPLESQEVNRLAELVIAIDTSGSCRAETVRRFLAETWQIVSCRENFFREMKVYLIQCDCLVQSVTVIRSPEDWLRGCGEITIQGRGGTDFTPVFRYVEELRRKKELRDLRALLYFTDGDGVYPRQKPDYETAFVFLGKNNKMDQVPAWAVRLTADWLEQEETEG